jgi:hypothetical protein
MMPNVVPSFSIGRRVPTSPIRDYVHGAGGARAASIAETTRPGAQREALPTSILDERTRRSPPCLLDQRDDLVVVDAADDDRIDLMWPNTRCAAQSPPTASIDQNASAP